MRKTMILTLLGVLIIGFSLSPAASSASTATIQEPLTMSYDRQAARDYLVTYCTPSDPLGYAHFVAHVLCAGGLPIHNCAGQGHADPPVINVAAQRAYVKSLPDVQSLACSGLQPADLVYIGKGACWGSVGGVAYVSGGIPYIIVSGDCTPRRYDMVYSSCGTPSTYDCVHIDSADDHYYPSLSVGLNLDPPDPRACTSVTASFTLHNYGGQSIVLPLRVTTNGYGDFAEVSCNLPSYGDCEYSQVRSFDQPFSANVCAQMYLDGVWQDIPAMNGETCQSLIVSDIPVRLAGSLALNPGVVAPGKAIQASFFARNNGFCTVTERYRVRVISGAVTFTETSDIALGPGESYAYASTQSFTQSGGYEVSAEHHVRGQWVALPGLGFGFFRVLDSSSHNVRTELLP